MLSQEYTITEQQPLVGEYLALRAAVGWSNPSPATATAALRGSLHCVCVWQQEALVAFGRVVGDGSFTFYIQDMIVHPEHQGHGLGGTIMQHLLHYIQAAGGDDAYIGLMAARDAVGFYERFGFSARPEDAPGMQRLPLFLRR